MHSWKYLSVRNIKEKKSMKYINYIYIYYDEGNRKEHEERRPRLEVRGGRIHSKNKQEESENEKSGRDEAKSPLSAVLVGILMH